MNAKNLQTFLQSLSETAFVRVDGDLYRWDVQKGKGALRQELPWQIQNWEIDAKNGDVKQTAFAARLNAELFLQNLEDSLKTEFPSFRKATLEADKKNGFWLLVEFLDPALDADQSRLIENDEAASSTLPHGLAAVHLSIIQAVGQISIFMTKHSFLGNTPGAFFIELPKSLNQALFGIALQEKTHFNSYLLTLKSEELRSALIDYARLSDSAQQLVTTGNDSAFGQVKLSFENKNWKLTWVSGEEVPELLVPPMEILEQKEVARRFQRLDELILLEDYQGALDQCREYLEKNPQSLYLVRRWAFLTLWADAPFEKKYLDLMLKFDPQNLMTLSLSIRQSFLEGQSDLLLESLSKLGASFGQSVVDFEDLDITSLTLPEMLGDAWNHKDDQRAVSCYERVLQSRGEIPRILVKLIRLMRDIEDSTAEEAYMDRLLACEVPTRTRAAIYFRLAEIKQKVDITDASQWALKSWHTHRIQIRYAMLAADLLIQLDRPHDAVHVLLETSELLEGQEADQHLELELKIAGIWLESMQRLDLASERVMRALELVGSDAKAFDEILRLVKKFDDPALMMEVTLKALELADASGDLQRARHYAEDLLQLVDQAGEGPNAQNIYKNILLSTLPEAADVQRLLSRKDLNLPFQDICESMEKRLEHLTAKEQAPYYLAFGEIAQDKLEDSEKIFRFYEKALSAGVTNARSSDFLDSYYSRMGMNTERFALLQKKLEHAQGSERAVILRELYYFDEGVPDSDKDSYALQILREDNDDVGPLEERLHHYESEGQSDAIAKMMNDLARLDFEPSVVSTLIRAGLQSIESLGGEQRHAHMISLLTRLRDAGEDPLEIARLTLQYLWDASDKNYARSSLALLIHQDQIPDLPLGDMLNLLDDDKLKAELLILLANKASDFEEILGHERSALRIVRDNPMLIGLKLDIQRRLAPKIEFTLSELEHFIQESRSLGRDSDTLPALQAQLKVSVHLDHRDFVLAEFESEIRSLASDSGKEADILQKILEDLPLEDGGNLRLVWLEKFGAKERLHEERFLAHALSDSKLWASRGLILNLIEYRLAQRSSLDETIELVNRFVMRLMTEHREETLRYFVDEPAIFQVLNRPALRMAMDFSVLQKDLASFEHFWSKYLTQVEDSGEALEFLRDSRRYFADLDNTKLLFDKLEQLIDSGAPRVQANMLFEAKLYLADHLAEFNVSQKRVRQLLEELYAEHPEDSRIWAALISIFREMKAEGELFELLDKVLPILKENPKPLKEYQISITGLELEFDELKSKIEKVREGRDDIPYDSTLVSSDAISHETLFSRPESTSESLPLQPEAGFRESFSLNEPTEVSSTRKPAAFDVSHEDEPESSPQFAFSLESAVHQDVPPAADEGGEFGGKPMNTSVTPLPQNGATNFRLENTQTEARPKALNSEAVSLYENTSVFNPVPDLSAPPPPPPASGLEFAHSPMSSASNPPAQSLPEPEASHEAFPRADLSSAWKTVAKTAQVESGLLKELLAYPLEEATEQIVAVQVSALVEDKVGMLESFPHKIWRDPSSLHFELKWTGRMTREQFHPGIKAPLARLLKALYPMFIQTFAHEMGLAGVADRLKMRPDEILKIRKGIDYADEVIQRSNLKFYVGAFQDAGYNLFHLPSIGDRFQFDFEKRDIYIDRNHYMAAPPTHIFHRLAFLLRAVNLDYFPFLHLSPSGEIYPFLMKCKRSLDHNDGMKRLLGQEKDVVKQMLAQTKDREHIAALFAEVGTLSADRISQSVSHFIEQIYRLNLAETLDLIGLIETISGVDLLNPRASSSQRIHQSNSAKSIMAFAAELKFQKE